MATAVSSMDEKKQKIVLILLKTDSFRKKMGAR
jgi:hypothetical protein